MIPVVRDYLAECQRQRIAPYEGFITHLDVGVIDCDLDTAPIAAIRVFGMALSGRGRARDVSSLRSGRAQKSSSSAAAVAAAPPLGGRLTALRLRYGEAAGAGRSGGNSSSNRRSPQQQRMAGPRGTGAVAAAAATDITALTHRGALRVLIDGVCAAVMESQGCLRSFQLSGFPLSEVATGAAKLVRALAGCSVLRTLSLSRSRLSPEVFSSLLSSNSPTGVRAGVPPPPSMEACFPALVEVDLRQCGLTDRCTRVLRLLVSYSRDRASLARWRSGLRSNTPPPLRRHQQQRQQEQAPRHGDDYRRNSQQQQQQQEQQSGVFFTSRRAAAGASAGPRVRGLERMDVSSNALGDAALLGLAHTIRSDSCLRTLNLSDNAITVEGLWRFLESGALEEGVLDVFDLSRNPCACAGGGDDRGGSGRGGPAAPALPQHQCLSGGLGQLLILRDRVHERPVSVSARHRPDGVRLDVATDYDDPREGREGRARRRVFMSDDDDSSAHRSDRGAEVHADDTAPFSQPWHQQEQEQPESLQRRRHAPLHGAPDTTVVVGGRQRAAGAVADVSGPTSDSRPVSTSTQHRRSASASASASVPVQVPASVRDAATSAPLSDAGQPAQTPSLSSGPHPSPHGATVFPQPVPYSYILPVYHPPSAAAPAPYADLPYSPFHHHQAGHHTMMNPLSPSPSTQFQQQQQQTMHGCCCCHHHQHQHQHQQQNHICCGYNEGPVVHNLQQQQQLQHHQFRPQPSNPLQHQSGAVYSGVSALTSPIDRSFAAATEGRPGGADASSSGGGGRQRRRGAMIDPVSVADLHSQHRGRVLSRKERGGRTQPPQAGHGAGEEEGEEGEGERSRISRGGVTREEGAFDPLLDGPSSVDLGEEGSGQSGAEGLGGSALLGAAAAGGTPAASTGTAAAAAAGVGASHPSLPSLLTPSPSMELAGTGAGAGAASSGEAAVKAVMENLAQSLDAALRGHLQRQSSLVEHMVHEHENFELELTEQLEKHMQQTTRRGDILRKELLTKLEGLSAEVKTAAEAAEKERLDERLERERAAAAADPSADAEASVEGKLVELMQVLMQQVERRVARAAAADEEEDDKVATQRRREGAALSSKVAEIRAAGAAEGASPEARDEATRRREMIAAANTQLKTLGW